MSHHPTSKFTTKLLIKLFQCQHLLLLPFNPRLWLVFVCIITILIYSKRNRIFENIPPGPLANYIPFVGYLPFINPKRPEETFMSLAKKYGKIYSVQMGSIFTVVLSGESEIVFNYAGYKFASNASVT